MEISTIIPCKDEEKRIINSLNKIYTFLKEKKFNFEIIVVNDGSTDKTEEVVKEFITTHPLCKIITHETNYGKGKAVDTGIKNSTKDFILFSDADLSTPIEELENFSKYIGFDIIIGSRKIKGSKIIVQQPWYRRIPGQVFPLIVNILGISKLKDTQCGFKLFKKEVAKELFKKRTIDRFSFDAEIMYIAEKYKYKIKELPVTWENSLDSKLNAISDSYKMFKELIQIKINDFKGAYK